MLRIAISCGEGFSSGFLAGHLSSLVQKEQLQDQVSFVRIPFPELEERQDEVDIAMIMPHIEPQAKASAAKFNIPLYIIPFKAVVAVKAEAFMEDAEDILSFGKTGIVGFPGEERTVNVKRLTSHRTWMNEHAEVRA